MSEDQRQAQISERVRIVAEMHGMGVDEMAMVTGVDRVKLADGLAGRRRHSMVVAATLAEHFGFCVEWLMSGACAR